MAKGDLSELIRQWKAQQEAMRRRLIVCPIKGLPRFIAGADAAFSADKKTVFAAAVVYDRQENRIVEIAHATTPATVPYVPGYLTFREGPAVLAAIRSLQTKFELIMFDGQGYAHPRRCGIASYLSIELDMPAIGVAKSRLIGTFDEPPPEAGASTPLMDGDEQIGIVLRTRPGVRPLFISIGHRADLESAGRVVMACCPRYRVPEPTRQADIEVARLKQKHCAGR
jgi:deoxyribonuclease V